MAHNPTSSFDRRRLLQNAAGFGGLGLVGLSGCATSGAIAGSGLEARGRSPFADLAPIRARPDRMFDITVCLRPFRAQGPRLDAEQIGDSLIVHNYGHGGSGWSLSWGSSTMAVKKAMAGSPRDVAVVGCGALGLTSAILAQRAGARVTIYARDLLPDTRSARATGSWTPDSRIALTDKAGPGFAAVWEEMARTSFKTYRNYLGLPGGPVVWMDRYTLLDYPRDDPRSRDATPDPLGFGQYHDSIRDLTPKAQLMPGGETPFDAPYVYRTEGMIFNLADYGHQLMSDFLAAGGAFQHAEFHAPAEIAALKEKVVINCPGYGARALWKDESITPVRGQIAWLIPQPEVNYGVFYKGVSVYSRTDGVLVQSVSGGDIRGYGDANETIDRAEAESGVATLAELYGSHFKTTRPG